VRAKLYFLSGCRFDKFSGRAIKGTIGPYQGAFVNDPFEDASRQSFGFVIQRYNTHPKYITLETIIMQGPPAPRRNNRKPPCPHPGFAVSIRAELNLKLMCYALRFGERTSRAVNAIDLTLDTVRKMKMH